MRLAPGLYAEHATLPPEEVTRQHLYPIVASTWPGAVVSGRSAFHPREHPLYVSTDGTGRRGKLVLPGITIVPFVGPGALPGDQQLVEGVYLAGTARSLVENVDVRGRPGAWRAGTRAVEDKIDQLARTGGAVRIHDTLNQLDAIAEKFDPSALGHVRGLLKAVLGSSIGRKPLARVLGPLAARLSGEPYDLHRVEMLEGLAELLDNRAPKPVPQGGSPERWRWQPFFEAYFSNFIEGTEFGVDEARRIAVDGVVPVERPADAHDVAATYRLASDPNDAALIPNSADDLIELLHDRHAVLMAARPEKNPGSFKNVPNYAGGYEFVQPDLVVGTLRKGFDVYTRLLDPFARALCLMALITECHPFNDGNGRIARLFSNAELSAARQVRFCIPTVYRSDYLAALHGFSNRNGTGESLIAVLDFAQRWTAAVSWSSYEEARDIVEACHGFDDPVLADRIGIRLLMPPRIGKS